MKRRGDAIDGVMLLDKPCGMSSNHALQAVRRAINAQKAGHTGTLDPLASGLLPLCFGNATKFSADLLHADKGYVARVRLGVVTTTGDAEGEVLETHPVGVTQADVERAAASFVGEIDQIPPMYSALKRNGEALYDIARRGETVEREARRVTVKALSVEDFDGESFTMRCLVSKGTYVRVLGEDIGRALGCGAHLSALRRTRVGELDIGRAVTMEEIESAGSIEAVRALLAPVDSLLQTLPALTLTADLAERFRHGQRLRMDAVDIEGPIRVYDDAQRLLGTGRMDAKRLSPVRLVSEG